MAGYLGFDATDEKPFIFVSYNTEDQVRLSKIAKELRAHQINIWYDNGIHRISDEEWQEQIAIHIREAEIVFFFLTQGIFEKKNSFVKKEYDLATRHAKKICLVMLDEIDPQIIPAKYDFWWGDISNRQSIEAARMSEVQIAEEICKECRRAGIAVPAAQQVGSSGSVPQHGGVPGPRTSGSQASGSNQQQAAQKSSPAVIIAAAVIILALLGLLGYRALSGSGKNDNKPVAATAANTGVGNQTDASEKPQDASAVSTANTPVETTDLSATKDASGDLTDAADTPAVSDDTPAASEDTPADAANNPAASEDTPAASEDTPAAAEDTQSAPAKESKADADQQDSPYKDVVLPKSVPDEYYFYKDHTYAFYDASRYGFTTYEQVAEFCRQQGGHLAVINNDAENTYLFELLRDISKITAFFGYSDEDSEGDWQWSDGDSSYSNWTTYGSWDLPDNGEAYGGDEDYAEFNYERGKKGIPNDGTWNDAPFMDNTTTFICEWDFDVNKAREYKNSQDN